MNDEVPRWLIERSDDPRLRDWLERRRWFADKGRGITRVTFEDALVAPLEQEFLALAIAGVTLGDGTTARYLLTLALAGAEIGPPVAGDEDADGRAFVDAVDLEQFAHWFLAQFGGEFDAMPRNWQFSVPACVEPELRAAQAQPAIPMRAEQSNTSLRFGDEVIVKLIRRLQPGPNPDAEILRALADGGFTHVPRFLGEASWRSVRGDAYPFALVQAFVPNEGDGWTWMLRRLQELARSEIEPLAELAPERQLGRRTGELHAVLSRAQTAAFVPELASDALVEREIERMARAGEVAIALLADIDSREPDLLPVPLSGLQLRLREVSNQAAGLRDEIGLPRIRVHGDYHLGQTLRRPDGDWMIIDFEGEPARPVEERRQKSSPLKDVAGMLRSFAYARRATERAMDTLEAVQLERLARWERDARREFVAGYRDALAAAAVSLVPGDAASFQRALAAWELDKALYEIAYEARNRPDWIDLPLRALLPDDES